MGDIYNNNPMKNREPNEEAKAAQRSYAPPAEKTEDAKTAAQNPPVDPVIPPTSASQVGNESGHSEAVSEDDDSKADAEVATYNDDEL